jgi:hypothetical protein
VVGFFSELIKDDIAGEWGAIKKDEVAKACGGNRDLLEAVTEASPARRLESNRI